MVIEMEREKEGRRGRVTRGEIGQESGRPDPPPSQEAWASCIYEHAPERTRRFALAEH